MVLCNHRNYNQTAILKHSWRVALKALLVPNVIILRQFCLHSKKQNSRHPAQESEYDVTTQRTEKLYGPVAPKRLSLEAPMLSIKMLESIQPLKTTLNCDLCNLKIVISIAYFFYYIVFLEFNVTFCNQCICMLSKLLASSRLPGVLMVPLWETLIQKTSQPVNCLLNHTSHPPNQLPPYLPWQ